MRKRQQELWATRIGLNHLYGKIALDSSDNRVHLNCFLNPYINLFQFGDLIIK